MAGYSHLEDDRARAAYAPAGFQAHSTPHKGEAAPRLFPYGKATALRPIIFTFHFADTGRSRQQTTMRFTAALLLAATAPHALARSFQFNDLSVGSDSGSVGNARVALPAATAKTAKKSTAKTSSNPFTAEAAAALVANSSSDVTKWDVSSEEAAQTTAGGYVTGNWTTLDASEYEIKACAPQTWNVTKKKVTSLWLRFSSIDASGDQVVVSAANGSSPQSFDDAPDGVTTAPIAGKALKIEFRPSKDSSNGCKATGVKPKMKVDAVGFQWSKEMLVTKENICGAKDTMKNAICATQGDDSQKTMYAKAKAVIRTERVREDNALVTCTAWLWGNKGHIVSNHHCFSSQDMVDKTNFQFMVETAACDGKCNPGQCPVGQTLAGKGNVQFIKSDAYLDYAVLKITNDPGSYIGKYGFLQIRFAVPTKGEEIYLPQHPYGGPKKIAMTDDDEDKATATIKDVNYQITVSGQKYSNLVGYAADTAGGSSGSPVLAKKDHAVVGLHRIGDCNNAATSSGYLAGPLLGISSDNSGFLL
ncbi:hypothetical protein FI667_g10834, partial [Globisporangium splendens]